MDETKSEPAQVCQVPLGRAGSGLNGAGPLAWGGVSAGEGMYRMGRGFVGGAGSLGLGRASLVRGEAS